MKRHEKAGLAIVAAAGLSGSHAAGQQDLHNNGPFITHPGQGSGGADVSVLQTSLGSSSYGYSSSNTSSFRLADDFVVPAGGWTVSSIVFFDFQSNAPLGMPTINNVNLRIWRGRPDDSGSVVVFGSVTLNRWVSSATAHAFRTPDSNFASTQREIFRVEAAVSPPVMLTPGTYWIDWQTGGTLPSGPFTVPVTVLGMAGAPGANARFFDGQAWSNLRDGSTLAAQELAFIVRGTAAGGSTTCYANCDGSTAVPFLNVNDFICFQSRFAAGSSYANCDGSTAAPVLNVNDFICFQSRFASGCSAP